jgi:DNA-binding transcriptional LysR family regulator
VTGTKNFRTLDLNLLHIFDSLMTVGSLTRAAEALAITQPAASHALKRLHGWVGEPLFQRNASGMTPTPRALALWPQVRAALDGLQQALAPTGFDPRRTAAEFRLAMGDAAAATLAPGIVQAVEAAQAIADLRILPLTTRDPRSLLHDELADLAVGHFPALLSVLLPEGERALLRQHRLHRTDHVCVMRREHPLAAGELTLERYCAAHHVLVSLSGQAYAAVDEALALIGRSRRVLLTVNQYHTARQVILQSDLLTVLPASFVQTAALPGAVVTRPLPVEIAPMAVDMVWLARRDTEPAHRWLREQVQDAARRAQAAADARHG